MSKVLLVDTNFSSQPIFSTLVAMGHEVHVVGKNPMDCLAKVSPHYWQLDYADVDSLKNLIQQKNFDFIVPGCTDRSYASCVAVGYSKFPGIDSPSAEQSINNKADFRRIAERLELPIPKLQNPDQETWRWPLIVKPVDSFSGKGITILLHADTQALQKAIEKAKSASASGQYLIEDYIIGDLHSHSAFLKNKKIIKDYIVQENGTTNPFVVDTSRVVPDPDPALLADMRKSIEKLAMALNLNDGLVHTQFILRDGQFWLIEITRRCPGDLYSQLIELTTGTGYVLSYIKPFLGLPLEFASEPKPASTSIMRHTLTVKEGQSFAGLTFKYPVHIKRWIPLSLIGDQLSPSPASRIAILFTQSASQTDLQALYERTLQRQLYEVLS